MRKYLLLLIGLLFSSESGAGMYNVGSSPAVKYCTFTSNHSSLEGGEMYNEDCISDITNCIFTSNYSDQKGGGISNRTASPVMTNSTIRFNYATFGGALYNNVLSFPKISNSIIWENISNIYLNNMKNEVGSAAEFSYCLIEGSRGSVNWNSLIGADGGNNIDADPLFTSETDFSLRVGSPAVDAGSNSLYKGNINTDQDLGGRVRLKGGAVDMGVYESLPIIPLADAAGIIYVNQKGAGDFSGNSWANATPSLAEALKFAHQNNRVAANPKVKQIWVAKGIYWPMYNPSSFIKDGKNNAFRLVDNVKVYGGFDPDNGKDNLATRNPKDNVTTLSGDFNENDAVDVVGNILDINSYNENAYHVVISAGEVNQAELNGFTIKGGDARGYGDINISTQYQLTIFQKNGGGMYIARSSPRLDHITFKSNNSMSEGGGMYIENSFPTITNCLFGSNVGKYGGAMSNEKSSPTVINSYFISNKGSICSGVYNDGSSPDIINSTFSLNEIGSYGSVIYNQNSSSPKIYNSIIYGNDNSNVSVVKSDGTSKPEYAYSIIQNSGGSANWRISGDNQGGNIDADPKFVSTTDFSLREGSRAINTGNNDLFTDLDATTKDRAGNLRLQKGTIDMGAFESPYATAPVPDSKGILYVKKGGAGNFTGNNWDNAIGELADALIFAKRENEFFGSTRVRQIWVAGGIYKPMYSPEDGVNFGTDKRRDNAFLLVKDVEVYGGFAGVETLLSQRDLTITGNRTTLSGDFKEDDVVSGAGANSENNFNVVMSVGDSGYSGRLDGFTISGGNADNSSVIKVNSLDVIRSKGGGMLCFKSSLTIRNSVFVSNTAIYGAGMSIESSSNFNISNTRFVGNYSTDSGGGLYIDSSRPTIVNSAFSSNYAAQEGGGVFITSSEPLMRNCSFGFNSAGVRGAGIMSSHGSKSYLSNSIVWANTTDNISSIQRENYLIYNSLIGGSGGSDNWNILAENMGGNIDVDPMFVSESDLSLQAGSPAVNAGNNYLYPGNINGDKDLAGNPRLRGGTIDLGAYERQKEPQIIAPISNITKVYGESIFEPGASSTSGLPISYSSSNSSIAEAYQDAADGDKWKIKIIAAGTVNITANQIGDDDFDAAEPVGFTFTITRKPVEIRLTSARIEKVYDGTADAPVSSSNFSFAGGIIVGTDDLGISLTGLSATYFSKNAASGKPVIIPLAGLELSGTSAINYEITNTDDLIGIGDITQKELTVVTDDRSKVYGEDLNAAEFTGNIIGIVDGDMITLTINSIGAVATAVVGPSYPIVATLVDSNYDSANYKVVNANGVLTVTPKDIELVANNQVKIYGDNFAFTGAEFTQPQGLINGDAVSQVSLSSVGAVASAGVGSYDVVPADANGTGLGNYNIKYTNGQLVIGQRTLTVVTDDRSKVYGEALDDVDFIGDITGVIAGDGITLTRNSSGSLATAVVGLSYPIVATLDDPNNKLGNYNVVNPDGILTVTPKAIDIVANNQVKIYGESFAFTGAEFTQPPGLINGDEVSKVSLSSAGTVANATVGSYDIVPVNATGTGLGNYSIKYTNGQLQVGQRTLTVVNDDRTKVYGEVLDVADFTGDITGVIAGDGITLTRNSAGSLATAVVGSTYSIVATLADPNNKLSNYTIVNPDGVLTVTPKNIELIANNQVKTYGESFAFTGNEFTQPQGLINGDAVSQVSLSSVGAVTSAGVGSYDVVPADANGTGLGNYNIKYTNGQLQVGQRTLTVVNDDRSKVYGEVLDDVDFFGDITGVVAGDGITLTRNSIGAVVTAVAGTSPIVATFADPNNKLSNYNVVNPDGVLTVTPKAIDIVANNQVKTYGESFAFTGAEFTQPPGLINGDEVSKVSLSSAGTVANATVGSYDIVPVNAIGTGLGNYSIKYTNGQLQVGQRSLTVVNDNRSKVYGTVLNADDFIGSITGVAAGDGIALTRNSTGAIATAIVDSSYPIVATLADPNNKLSNYKVVNAVGVLTVTPKDIELVANNQVKIYGESFAFTGNEFTQPQGLINGDAVDLVSLSSAGAVANTTVGSYDIIPVDAIGTGLGNYNIRYTNGQLVIGQRTLTVVNDDRSKVYGEALDTDDFSGSVTGVVSGDGITLTRNSSGSLVTAVVGSSYPIVATLDDPNNKLGNYTVVNPNAVLTITPKELVITAVDKERFVGLSNPELTARYDGFVNGENSTILTAQPVLHTSADLSSAPGTYGITVSAAAATNYSIRYVEGLMKVMANEPTDIILAATVLYENAPEGTHAGTLSSTSPDLSAVFTYSLVSGKGDANNSLFTISGDKIKTTSPLDFETSEYYKIRVRVSNQYGKWLEKELGITVSDVNEVPTMDAISNQTICYTRSLQSVSLTGITAGPETGQKIGLTVSSSNPTLFDRLSVSGNGPTGKVSYQIKAGATGVAQVTVTVKDDGDTANGGVDTYSQTFEITVNALPVLNITSDKGTQVSLGETIELNATGAATFVWAADNSILSGGNSGKLTVRPKQTTTYTVTGTNASGCTETKSFTITVLNDLAKIKTTNILSPNGDGYNDLWIVDHIDMYPNNEVKVFDKTGRIVYSKKGYDNSWDGTFNGTALAEGTYYYIIDFRNGKRNFKGFITIIREN